MAGNVASGSISLNDIEERMKRLDSTFQQQNINRSKSASPQSNKPAARPQSKS